MLMEALNKKKSKKILTERLETLKSQLHAKSQTDNGLSEKELKLSKQVNTALKMRKLNE